jgi:hypothetical protein
MFENYIFEKQDFRAIEKTISMTYDRQLERVFARGLGNFDLISYDAKFVYLWSRNDYSHLEKFKPAVCQFQIYRFLHNRGLEGLDFVRMGLATGDFQLGGRPFNGVPQKIHIHAVPLTIWLDLLEKQHKVPTRDLPFERTYYPIILLHEIAHFYFFENFSFRTSVQESTLVLAQELVKNPKELKILFQEDLANLLEPLDTRALSELFSTLVELEAVKIFYPKLLEREIQKMAAFTARRFEDPKVGKIEVAINANLYGKILAAYIFKSFPNWPEKLHQLWLN